jgi:phenylalanyl-tRNA synthetase beta chain
MLVPYNWLKDYVDFDYSADELAEKLTMAGLEVETVVKHDEGISGVVVGEIRSVKPHPSADRLVLCDVDVGGQVLEIVCGATNMKAGDKVPVAIHGATLPGGVRIRKGKIRGVTSEGMLCSEIELRLGEDADGIMVLPSHLEEGTDLNVALALEEPILDVQVMPNRGDWASMIGVAREVAVFAGARLKMPEASFPKGEVPVDSLTSVQIDDPDMCPRYAARVVQGVHVAPSPHWMQDRLLKGGLRPVNNIVDATNYVLLELGQPLHAFDYDRLAENRIVVRRARQGEKAVTLDGEERALLPDILVIADAVKPVALAGIMGGKDPEVSDATTNVFIESAFFDPGTIRRGSKKLGLSTEASYRFERGTDPEMVLTAADRAAGLIQEMAGGEFARGIIDNYPRPVEPVELALRPPRANALLGTDIPAQDMAEMLARLGFSTALRDDNLAVTVPSYRHDARREADLIEEVARVHGYDKIPSSSPRAPMELPRQNDEFSLQKKTTDALLGLGMTQVITLTFSSPEDMERIGYADRSDQMVALLNPMSEKQNSLRASLIPGIMRVLERNSRHGRFDCTIFEIGRVFASRSPGEQPDEILMVAGAVTGKVTADHWTSPGAKPDFFYMKGIVESLLNELQCRDVTFRTGSHPALSESATAEIWAGDKACGSIGEVSKTVLQRFDIEEQTFLFELDLDSLRLLIDTPRFHEPIPKFPPSRRDLAVIVADHVQAEDLTTLIRTAGGELVDDITLFDLYRGPQVPDGMKSIAFSVKYLASDRTLTDEEVNELHQKIVEALVVKFHARLREE